MLPAVAALWHVHPQLLPAMGRTAVGRRRGWAAAVAAVRYCGSMSGWTRQGQGVYLQGPRGWHAVPAGCQVAPGLIIPQLPPPVALEGVKGHHSKKLALGDLSLPLPTAQARQPQRCHAPLACPSGAAGSSTVGSCRPPTRPAPDPRTQSGETGPRSRGLRPLAGPPLAPGPACPPHSPTGSPALMPGARPGRPGKQRSGWSGQGD